MQTLKMQLKQMIIRDLKLEGVQPEAIDDKAMLFGDGLGLDSLDAVELVLLVQKNFGVQIADMEEGRKAFASIEALAAFIQQRREGEGK